MLHTLIASDGRRRGARPWPQGAIALALHTALLLGAVRLSQGAHPPPTPRPDAIRTIYVADQTTAPSGTLQRAALPAAPSLDIEPSIGAVPAVVASAGPPPDWPAASSGHHSRAGLLHQLESPGQAPFAAGEADDPPALLVAGSAQYPPALARAGISGWVQLAFVVDSTGQPDAATLRVHGASRPEFIPAARAMVLSSRYRAGRVRGRPVAVWVEQRIHFAH